MTTDPTVELAAMWCESFGKKKISDSISSKHFVVPLHIEMGPTCSGFLWNVDECIKWDHQPRPPPTLSQR